MQVGFSARLAWSEGHRRNLFTDRSLLTIEQRNSTATGTCTLQCDADVSVAVTLPGVYGALLPRGILGACYCFEHYTYLLQLGCFEQHKRAEHTTNIHARHQKLHIAIIVESG
jgi:hypothetical protein